MQFHMGGKAEQLPDFVGGPDLSGIFRHTPQARVCGCRCQAQARFALAQRSFGQPAPAKIDHKSEDEEGFNHYQGDRADNGFPVLLPG